MTPTRGVVIEKAPGWTCETVFDQRASGVRSFGSWFDEGEGGARGKTVVFS